MISKEKYIEAMDILNHTPDKEPFYSKYSKTDMLDMIEITLRGNINPIFRNRIKSKSEAYSCLLQAVTQAKALGIM